MKIRALKSFEGIKDLERDVFPKEGDVWEVSEERAEFLKSHGVIEFVEEVKEKTIEEKVQDFNKEWQEFEKEVEEKIKASKKKNKKASE